MRSCFNVVSSHISMLTVCFHCTINVLQAFQLTPRVYVPIKLLPLVVQSFHQQHIDAHSYRPGTNDYNATLHVCHIAGGNDASHGSFNRLIVLELHSILPNTWWDFLTLVCKRQSNETKQNIYVFVVKMDQFLILLIENIAICCLVIVLQPYMFCVKSHLILILYLQLKLITVISCKIDLIGKQSIIVKLQTIFQILS